MVGSPNPASGNCAVVGSGVSVGVCGVCGVWATLQLQLVASLHSGFLHIPLSQLSPLLQSVSSVHAALQEAKGVGVFAGVFVGAPVGVKVGVLVGPPVGVSVGSGVSVGVGVAVGAPVAVGVAVGIITGQFIAKDIKFTLTVEAFFALAVAITLIFIGSAKSLFVKPTSLRSAKFPPVP